MLKTIQPQNRDSEKLYFNFFPALENHRDIRLAIEMKAVLN